MFENWKHSSFVSQNSPSIPYHSVMTLKYHYQQKKCNHQHKMSQIQGKIRKWVNHGRQSGTIHEKMDPTVQSSRNKQNEGLNLVVLKFQWKEEEGQLSSTEAVEPSQRCSYLDGILLHTAHTMLLQLPTGQPKYCKISNLHTSYIYTYIDVKAPFRKTVPSA